MQKRMMRGHASSREKHVTTSRVIDSYFMFQRDRYLSAVHAFNTELDKALSYLAFDLKEEVTKTVTTSSVIFLPEIVSGESIYVKFLIKYEFNSYTTLPELLREKEEVLKGEFGITSGQLMLLTRKKITAMKQIEQDIKGKVVASASIITAGIGASESDKSKSMYQLDSEDVAPILRLIMMEADKRGILKRGKELVIVNSPDLAIFGNTVVQAGTGLKNTKLAVDLPVTSSPSEAGTLYEILKLPTTSSLFIRDIDTHRVVEAVLDAILSYNKLPKGLKKLIEYLDREGILWAGVKRIVSSVGTNPVMAFQVTVEWLSILYGYMNRRIDKLINTIDVLIKNGNVKTANMISNELNRRIYMSLNIALRNIVGSWRNTDSPVSERKHYLSHLKLFVGGLSDEQLLEIYYALAKKDGSMETFDALYNLGAFVFGPRDVKLTVIGKGLLRLVKAELTRRGMSLQHK